MNKNAVCLAIFSLFIAVSQLLAVEMPRSLRKAEKLYQNGKYKEASKEALKFQQSSPDNLQCLIILGMSDFYLNDYKSSKKWFKRAKELSKKHPIATRYLDLLRELEYKSGTFGIEPSDTDLTDPEVSGKYFKRAFFGTAFPVESKPNEMEKKAHLLEPVMLEPVVIKNNKIIFESASETAEIKVSESKPIYSYEATESAKIEDQNSIIENSAATDYMTIMAKEAMKEQKYEKAYLFYSQLLASQPKNRLYAISKAEAAYHLKKYSTVLSILTPISSKSSLATLSEEDRAKMKSLIEKSANKELVPRK